MNAETSTLCERFRANLHDAPPYHVKLSRHGGLTRLWADLGYRSIAEIGTEQGKFAAEILRDVPGVELYCVDPYRAYNRYEQHQTQVKLDGYYAEARRRLGAAATIIRKASLDAVLDFEPGVLDAVWIDANHHFDYVVRDIIAWAPIVRSGGMVCGHDYKPEGQERVPIPFGVIQAVNAYTDAHRIKPWWVFHGDKCPSWGWVVP
jgi:predicted O-methyltransferase YrrM